MALRPEADGRPRLLPALPHRGRPAAHRHLQLRLLAAAGNWRARRGADRRHERLPVVSPLGIRENRDVLHPGRPQRAEVPRAVRAQGRLGDVRRRESSRVREVGVALIRRPRGRLPEYISSIQQNGVLAVSQEIEKRCCGWAQRPAGGYGQDESKPGTDRATRRGNERDDASSGHAARGAAPQG